MLLKIAWKSIIHKPLNTALSVGLLLFGVAIISLILLLQHQLEKKFDRDLKNTDLVVGAKGSPLQLVLSTVYHLDAPTGNINLSDAQVIMNNPLVDEAIPLAYGDSYMGYRILGTTTDYMSKYDAQLADGQLYSKDMEAVLGAGVASKSGMKVGDSFLGTHGEAKGGHVHDDHPYEVVGILEKTNTVLDRLVLTTVASVWNVHAHNHGHDHNKVEEHLEQQVADDEMEITAIQLKYKTKMAALNMPRIINEQTNMQAALPALEINRLFYMLGIGATTLKLIAGSIMFMAGFSVFFILYSRLRDRKYELALLRSVGYRPGHLFALLVLEGLILSVMGYILGWLLSRAGIYFISRQAESDFNLQFGAEWVAGEAWLLLLTLVVGVVAAFLPAWKAMRMDVSSILSNR